MVENYKVLPSSLSEWEDFIRTLKSQSKQTEYTWLEIKSGVDSMPVTYAKIAKFILGASNRMPNIDMDHLSGYAVMLLGVSENGDTLGTRTLETLDLKNGMDKFLGPVPPTWECKWLPLINSSKSILIVCVPPTKNGDPIHLCYGDGDSVADGAFYIRDGASTRMAKSRDILKLHERASNERDLDIKVELSDPWGHAYWDEDQVRNHVYETFGGVPDFYMEHRVADIASSFGFSTFSVTNNSSTPIKNLYVNVKVNYEGFTYTSPAMGDKDYFFDDDLMAGRKFDTPITLGRNGRRIVGTGWVETFRDEDEKDKAAHVVHAGEPSLTFVGTEDITIFINVPGILGPHQKVTLDKQSICAVFHDKQCDDFLVIEWSATADGVLGKSEGSFIQEIEEDDFFGADITDHMIWKISSLKHARIRHERWKSQGRPSHSFRHLDGKWHYMGDSEGLTTEDYPYSIPHPRRDPDYYKPSG